MNTIFDFKRAGLLVQRHFIERFNGELMFWGVSIICMMFIRNILPALIAFAIITCIFRTGQFFREIHSATNRINYFMIPATQIEKFVVSLLFIVVYFWIVMTGVYVIGNILGTWVNNLLANTGFISDILGIHHQALNWKLFDFTQYDMGIEYLEKIIFRCAILILIFQSIFLLGGIYFKKNQIIKTFLVLAGVFLFLSVLTGLEIKYLIIDGYPTAGNIGDNDILKLMRVQSKIFLYLLTPYLWLTSYIRLTEKEV